MARKRSYTLRKRAESQEETRLRIVEAAMQLHEEIGPRATTISAIAERAGVQRLTVYRHFPDDAAVFQACTSHWLGLNPPPDASSWMAIAEGSVRARKALEAFYGYYRRNERMLDQSHRDVPHVPALHGPITQFQGYIRSVADGVLEAFGPHPADALRATVHHAFAFTTWQSLKDEGIDDEAIVDTVKRWIEAAAGTPELPDRQEPG